MISLIVAVDKNNAIGKDNKLLFNIKEDLNFFKEMTLNKTIVMGRKTFESLNCVLPDRKHIVLTRSKDFKVDNENVEISHSLMGVLLRKSNIDEEVFIIGGGEIYEQALITELVSTMYITVVDEEVDDADTFFPKIDPHLYKLVSKEKLTDKASVYKYKIMTDKY